MSDNPWKRAIEQKRMATSTKPPSARPEARIRSRSRPGSMRSSTRKRVGTVPAGASVKLSWVVPPEYGGGVGRFQGTVVECDDWIKVVNGDVTCHRPLSLTQVDA